MINQRPTMLSKPLPYALTGYAWRSFIIVIIAAIISGSCTTPPPLSTTPPAVTAKPPNDRVLAELLTKAGQATLLASPEKEQQLIDITRRLLDIQAYLPAEMVITDINSDSLNSVDYMAYVVTASQLYRQHPPALLARNILVTPRLQAIMEQLTITQQQSIHRARVNLYEQSEDVAASLTERIILDTLLSDPPAIQENNDAIWQQLSDLDPTELDALYHQTDNTLLRGWIELALISQQFQSRLEAQQDAVVAWLQHNPNHPIHTQLPAKLALLQELIDARPDHIALLLPLQGKLARAGQAIRDGFLAAYYLNRSDRNNHHIKTPDIRFYDTSAADIDTVYDHAVQQGANMVIGPLSKDHVNALQQRPTLAIPTLALNYGEPWQATDSTAETVFDQAPLTPLYQFGLSVEGEAIQIADHAWQQGHRHAVIISTKAQWSERATRAFIHHWQRYGGKVVASNQLESSANYSKMIEQLFNIDKSRARAKRLQRLIGRPLEFEPRRRADMDMIFLAVRPQQGREIKPTLDFHYASNIPVYATSQIYDATQNKNHNSDLNHVRLVTLPWELHQDIPEKALLDQHIDMPEGYRHLYALGVDSFLLYPGLQQLSHWPLKGMTGTLSMDPQQRIVRKQPWAKILQGKLQPLPVSSPSDNHAL